MKGTTIEKVEVIAPLHVEVRAKGARGGKQEWVLDYDRHNKVTGAFCYKGPTCPTTNSQYYPGFGDRDAAHHIPSEIKAAAWGEFAKTVVA